MNILTIPSLEPAKYSEYLKLLDEGTIILNGGRTASKLFDKWLNDNKANEIIYRGGYDEASQFVDYYFFYKKNEDQEDYEYLVQELVKKNI